MRLLLLFFVGCATVPERPPRNVDECQAQCEALLELCSARCNPSSSSPRMQASEAMGASECRTSCWRRDDGCRRECGERFRPKQ